MTFSGYERRSAVDDYRRLGLDVFPYDTQSVPFTGWNNPALWAPKWEQLVYRTHTFGVRLDDFHPLIDVDSGDLAQLEHDFGKLPPTHTVSTPRGDGGVHLMFTSNVPLRTCRKLKQQYPGIDFLAAGSNVKGATSVRYLSTFEEVMYKRRHPLLDPAPLPAALELEWARLAPPTVGDVHDELISEGLQTGLARSGQLAGRPEKLNVRKRVRDALRKIREAAPATRHNTALNASRVIFGCAVLLRESIDHYDAAIEEAYRDSGGDDFDDLRKVMRDVKVWVSRHPMPRPGLTAYQKIKQAELGEWADYALQYYSNPKRDAAMRALIVDLATHANTKFRFTDAGTAIVRRSPGCGDQKTVSYNLRRLAAAGWLIQDGHGVVEVSGFIVPHYRLDKRRD